jgi:L-lactate utilization protein LutB
VKGETKMNLDKLFSALERGGIAAKYFENKEQARDDIAARITGKKVVFGGSVTLKEMELYEALSKNNEVLWHWMTPELDRKSITYAAEVYMCSANGIAETGEIVNIDGYGNRLVGSFFTPHSSYFIVGINKIKPDLASAMDYAKNVASPLNAQRLNAKTPCAEKADKCYDCNSPGRICRVTSIISQKPMAVQHMEVIVIGENLGY